MKFVKKIIFSTFIALIGGIVVLFIAKNFFLNEMHISQTNTNLIETIDKNLLKTYQMPIDVFINYNAKYVGVVPYVVQAGFDLNKAKIEKLQDNSFLIKLPPPEITNINKDKTYWVKNSPDDSFLKQFWMYGELQAKYVALERGILEKANKHAKQFLPEFFASLGIKIKVETTEPKKVKYVAISSKRCGVDFKIPEEIAKNFEFINRDNELNPICVTLKSKDGRVIGSLIFPPPFYHITYYKPYRQFSTYNPNLKYYANFSYPLSFLYKATSKDLLFGWVSQESTSDPSSPDIEEKLPLIAFISSTLNDNHYTISETHDCFGITKSQWEQASIEEKRNLIESYFWGLPSKYYFDEKLMLITTEENYKDMPLSIKQTIKQLLSDKEYSKDFLFTIYERNGHIFHDDTLWIFWNNGKVTYIKDLGSFLNNEENPIVFPYSDFYEAYDRDHFLQNKTLCLKERDEICFSDSITPIITALKEYGFLKFYE